MTVWLVFALVVAVALLLDLFVMGRDRVIPVGTAIRMTVIYILMALLFGTGIGLWHGSDAALAWFAAYTLEKSLSLDNIFVFLLIFDHFRVPREFQHRVLVWGILGALVLRGLFIFAGVALVHSAAWVLNIFGVVVLVGGVRLLLRGQEKPDLEHNRLLRLMRRTVPLTPDYRGHAFLVREQGHWLATPLLAVMVMVETTDVVFAIDSIPAIFGISRDPFIIYTSNVFAILGLRALYFALAGVVARFRYLEYGLSLVLILIGLKLLLESVVEVPPLATVTITLTLLLGSGLFSLWRCKRRPGDEKCGTE
jgi:tellurite resistance protein TerC